MWTKKAAVQIKNCEVALSIMASNVFGSLVRQVWPSLVSGVKQGCQYCGLLGATLHVGNRAEGRMMFFNLEITTSLSNGLCNATKARSISKKKIIISPASPHHCPSIGIVKQKSSSVAQSEIH